ncbi:GNAT family N-acetyltransferase [Vreelandella titanicae]|uniref:Acyl-CoA N-acyltransferase n=2 Tax=Halomonadaceae TaxID=28256 RepID=L9U640_9GAMM|nr:GNAT family N-acetyltransferase [Halomonas titanicae]ELY20282.1 Acyl-CoA N-acyltransferase [Halomonas titanicae BH1]NVE92788.1 GNAT family N-acetyltransferase [Halomonas titanicae]QNU63033.1 GNAT family N-acetyltransferase [Halomonas titanicae]|tara:strand:- start:707 stop:1222 length:516 start_codon:yes stop_codon:yes gene_type:complete
MSDVKSRVLTPQDWQLYKLARLNSLEDAPDSFGSTYEQEVTLSDTEWQTRLDLKWRGLDALPLIAELEGQAVGLAWGVIHEPDTKMAHIYQMWVSPALRGKGIAKSLLYEISTWAVNKGCECIKLAVTTSNEAAVGFYTSSGYLPTGPLEALRVGSALMVQPMVKRLGNTQ